MEVHQWADDRIKTYLEKGRSDWQQLAFDVCHELKLGRSGRFAPVDLLYANNAESRINFAGIAIQHVQVHPALCGDQQVYFVTLTPERYSMRECDAASFNPRIIQAWTWEVLRGFNLIGMIEAALFPEGRDRASNLQSPSGRFPMISWHVHLLIWNTSYAKLNAALKLIKRAYPSFIVGTSSSFCRILESQEEIIHRVVYMLKAPQKQTRISRRQLDMVHDPATGEFVNKPEFNKDWLRTGQRVRMCRIMADKYIDRLFFGQADGTILRRSIVKEALKNFDRQKVQAEIDKLYGI